MADNVHYIRAGSGSGEEPSAKINGRSRDDRARLLRMIKELIEENQRLRDDNAQLRAAVAIYREVLRPRPDPNQNAQTAKE
ncbi:MAG TPA: hypothetical protein VKU19_02810 [Bryobacteraceae bacterium]|nr:hypothetical protein [Bryobacteraceae bacterium]